VPRSRSEGDFCRCVNPRQVPAAVLPRAAVRQTDALQRRLADDEQGKIAVAQPIISSRTDELLHLTGLDPADDD
jgi:hypothetical protein